MARRARDYRAEEARRNALARERGFTTRAAQRGAIRRGEAAPVQPSRIRTKESADAYEKYLERRDTGWTPERIAAFHTTVDEVRAADFSEHKANSPWATYTPDTTPEEHGVSREEYTAAYLAAWVVGDEKYGKDTRKHGSEALRHYLVDIMDMEPEEYDRRYGGTD